MKENVCYCHIKLRQKGTDLRIWYNEIPYDTTAHQQHTNSTPRAEKQQNILHRTSKRVKMPEGFFRRQTERADDTHQPVASL
jgi:hypothetical protein